MPNTGNEYDEPVMTKANQSDHPSGTRPLTASQQEDLLLCPACVGRKLRQPLTFEPCEECGSRMSHDVILDFVEHHPKRHTS